MYKQPNYIGKKLLREILIARDESIFLWAIFKASIIAFLRIFSKCSGTMKINDWQFIIIPTICVRYVQEYRISRKMIFPKLHEPKHKNQSFIETFL